MTELFTFILVIVAVTGIQYYLTCLKIDALENKMNLHLNENLNFLCREAVKLINNIEETQSHYNQHFIKVSEQNNKAYKNETLNHLNEAKELIGKLRLISVDLAELKKKERQKEFHT